MRRSAAARPPKRPTAQPPRHLAETKPRSGRFDLAGAITSTFGISALVYGFVRAASDGWGDPLTRGAFIVGLALLAVFLAVELLGHANGQVTTMYASFDQQSLAVLVRPWPQEAGHE